MSYLLKWKGQYRLKAPYDLRTNDFPRDEKGNYADNDIYIDCKHGNQIYHYGGKELVAYITSLGRGRNIVRKLKEEGKSDTILKVIESDEEVLIHFHVKDIELFADLLGARTSGAGISPFSVKNLPSDKPKLNKYEVPAEYKEQYDKMISLLKEWVTKQGLGLGKAYEKFYKDFGKSIKVDLVVESNKTNYKVVHIICQKGLINDAVNWLSKNS
jgi:hypothetical protein